MNETPPCCDLPNVVSADFFKALSDPSRLGILSALVGCCGQPRTVGTIAREFEIDLSVVSRHLSALRMAGLVEAERQGRETYYRCCYGNLIDVLRAAADAIERCCPVEDASCCSPHRSTPTTFDPKG
ncbi:MAG: metalloregulator ArsR/SmtB family transcription factor [Thermoanaerobaculia bacterium]|nr:metalloregulator ArsR/SmtB family transcription factor [Thermoanaerobaculia bacterium]